MNSTNPQEPLQPAIDKALQEAINGSPWQREIAKNKYLLNLCPNDLLSAAFVGKTLVASEFTNGEEKYDAYENPVHDFSPFGKKILKATFGHNCGDPGILTVEGYDNPFFFYPTDTISLS